MSPFSPGKPSHRMVQGKPGDHGDSQGGEWALDDPPPFGKLRVPSEVEA